MLIDNNCIRFRCCNKSNKQLKLVRQRISLGDLGANTLQPVTRVGGINSADRTAIRPPKPI